MVLEQALVNRLDGAAADGIIEMLRIEGARIFGQHRIARDPGGAIGALFVIRRGIGAVVASGDQAGDARARQRASEDDFSMWPYPAAWWNCSRTGRRAILQLQETGGSAALHRRLKAFKPPAWLRTHVIAAPKTSSQWV